MKHLNLILIAVLFNCLILSAQTPMFSTGNAPSASNSVPLAYQTNIRTQLLMPAGCFSTTPSSGMNITKIYFIPNTTFATPPASVTYTNFVITMGNVSLNSLSGSSWASTAGLTVALNAASYVLTLNGASWFSIPLTTPVSYDPTQPLLLDFTFTNQNMSGNWYISTSGASAGNYYQYGTPSTTSVPSGVTNMQTVFGIDLVSSGPPPVLGPLPTITNVSPSTGPVSMVDTIYGTNFSTTVANNVVNYGAVRANVSSALSNRLVVNVPGGTTLSPVSVNVNGLTAFSQNKFVTNFPNPSSIASTSFTNTGTTNSGYYLYSVINSDLNNDGKPDLISCSGGNVFVSRNLGTDNNLSSSSFASPVLLTASSGANHVITADIDGDGRLDIITANGTYNNISVFRNIIPVNGGNITSAMFAGRYDYTVGSYPFKIAAGDIDGDGKIDLVTANNNSNTISVLMNNGYPGVMGFTAQQTFSTGSVPYQPVLADIDADGRLDIVVTNSSSGTIGVYKNNSTSGTLSLATPVLFTAASWPYCIDAADMDGDGKTDLIVSNNSSGNISIFRNAGVTGSITAASFNSRFDFSALSTPVDIKIGELNGDGKPDIVLCNGSTGSYSVWQNNFTTGTISSSSLNTRQDFTASSTQRGVCIGDLDNDDRPDLCFVSSGSSGIFLHKNNISIFSLGNITPLVYASGSSLTIPFTITLPVTVGNIFTAQLSDSLGNFTSPVSIGSLIGTSSGSISAVIPLGTLPGTQYRVRVVSNTPNFISKASPPIRILLTPVVSSFSPTTASPGATITIVGSYFSPVVAENIVYFGPVKATVLNATTTSLSVSVPQSAVVGPISVNVLSYSGVSSKLFTPTFSGAGSISSSSLGTRVDFTTNTNPMNIDLADIDMDGKPDLITPNNGSNNIAVFRNTSVSGSVNISSLATRVSFATAGTPWHAQMVDIDGDGLKDMVSANNSVATLSVNRNTGLTGTISTSSFATRVDFTSASNITYIGYADLDGDGKIDLATANFSTNNISVFRNISSSGNITTGSFATRIDISTGASTGPICVVFNDVDMDGKADMIVANGTTNTISVFRNTSTNGNISFSAAVSFSTQSTPRYVVVADINNDNKPEIIVSNSGTSTISLYENISSPGTISASSLGTRVDLITASSPWGLAAGDIDGDGKADIAVACNSGSVSIIKNVYTSGSISSSSFASHVDFTTGSQPNGVAICDIDGDLKPDVVVTSFASNIVSIFPNAVGALTLNPISGQVCTGSSLIIAFNATMSFSAGNIFSAQLSNSSGSFVSPTTIGSIIGTTSGIINGTIPSSTATGTNYRIRIISSSPAMVSTDNLSDLWVSNCPSITNVSPLSGNTGTNVVITGTNFSATPSTNIVYFGAVRASVNLASATSITATVPLGATYKPVSVTTLNNNLTASYTRPFNETFVGPNTAFSSALLGTASTFGTASGPVGVAVGDIDGDGKTDMVTSSYNSSNVSVFRNINASAGSFTSSSFAARIDMATPSYFSFLKLADLDGDGKLDMICFINSTNQVSIFRNTSTVGNISFATRVDISTLSNPLNGMITDIDNDGKPDIIVPNNGSGSVSVFKNASTPGSITASGFSLRADFTTVFNPYSIAQGDFDSDGKMDFVVGTSNGAVYILRNTGNPIGASLFSTFSLTTGNTPYNVAVSDINSDGTADIVATNYNSFTVSVLRNNYTSGTLSSASFAAGTTLTTQAYPYASMFTDMDGDGRPDLIVSTYNSAGYVSFFRNISSAGTIIFDTRVDAVSGINYLNSVETADMDNDGKPDIVSANNANSLAYVWRNNLPSFSVGTLATGPFCTGSAISVPFTAPSGYFSLGNIFTAQLSDSSGSFASPVSIGSYMGSNSGTINATLPGSGISGTRYRIRVTASNPSALTSDNGSNITMISCPNISSISPAVGIAGSTVIISGTNLGSTPASNIVYFGSVRAVVSTASTTQLQVIVPKGAIVSQVTVTIGNYSTISQQVFTPSFAGTTSISSSSLYPRVEIIAGVSGVRSAMAADLDGDGKVDIHTSVGGSNVLAFFRNISSPGAFTSSSFASPAAGTTNTQPWNEATADFDNDGKLDLAAVNLGSNNISVFKNTSTTGTISVATKIDFSLTASSSPYSLATGDIDGDGLIDIVTANLGTNTISIFKNITTGGVINFAPKVDFTTATQPAGVIIAELDGDGKPDICVSNFGSNSISVFRNISSTGSITISSLASRQDFTTGTAPFFISFADIDQDGKIDILVPNYSSSTLSVLLNTSTTGTISLAAKVDFTTGSNPISIAVGDIDGDGKADVVTANQGGGNISVFKNTSTTGTINLATRVDFATQTGPICPAICDFDGDGRNDVLVANNGSNSISIFRNASLASEPTTQASTLVLNNITASSIKLTWTNGNGSGRIVLAHQGSAVNSNPLDTIFYSASTTFGSGSQVGTGNYVVYAGSSNTVTVTGLSTSTQYYFSVFEYNGTGGATNYFISSPANNNATTLPVTLLDFEAVYQNKNVLLTWKTGSEINNKGFAVQRSLDNNNWSEVGFLNGAGYSNKMTTYHFKDDVTFLIPDNKMLYYRLRQVDFDGKEAILPTRAVSLSEDKFTGIKIYPNPANKFITISMDDLRSDRVNYTVTDMMGSEVISDEYAIKSLQLINIETLPAGVYFIKVQNGEETTVHKFVKQ